jgi:hypothetical protein
VVTVFSKYTRTPCWCTVSGRWNNIKTVFFFYSLFIIPCTNYYDQRKKKRRNSGWDDNFLIGLINMWSSKDFVNFSKLEHYVLKMTARKQELKRVRLGSYLLTFHVNICAAVVQVTTKESYEQFTLTLKKKLSRLHFLRICLKHYLY